MNIIQLLDITAKELGDLPAITAKSRQALQAAPRKFVELEAKQPAIQPKP